MKSGGLLSSMYLCCAVVFVQCCLPETDGDYVGKD